MGEIIRNGEGRQRSGSRVVRRGSALIWTAAIWVMLIICVGAFSVDLGKYLYARAVMRDAIDAAAMAATSAMERGEDPRAAAVAVIGENSRGSVALETTGLVVTTGNRNALTKNFLANSSPRNAVSVTSSQAYTQGVFASPKSTINASSVAHFTHRDIVLVLDFSGSMNDGNKAQALRDAVKDFCDVVKDVGNGRDRIAMVHYSDVAVLEQPFSYNVTTLKNLMDTQVFSGATNIGDGLAMGINQISSNLRPTATGMIVLLTDGLANRPTDRDPIQFVRDQAVRANSLSIPVYTISIGADADQSLMQYVAATTASPNYYVVDGQPNTQSDLRAIFREVAKARTVHFVR